MSIGLPVRNGAAHLESVLESILEQSFGDFELIISDNASDDGTEAICRAAQAADPRVRYHRQERDRGAAWNFRRVFELARAPRFIWAAADDRWARDRLEVLHAAMRPGDACVCGSVRLIHRDRVWGVRRVPSFRGGLSGLWYLMLPEYASVKHFYVYGLFCRRRLARCMDAMRDARAQDVILVYRAVWQGGLRGVRGGHLDYRVHAGGVSSRDPVYASPALGRLRMLFFWQPADLYARYVRATPPRWRIVAMALLPFKWMVSQAQYLYRDQFQRRLLGRPAWPG